MKRFMIGCVGFGITVSFSHAQITITENDLPEAGYTYLVGNDTVNSVALGTPSAIAQNWDFSALTNQYPTVPTYDSTKFTPYAADFAASTHYTYGPAAMYSGFYGGAPVGQQGMDNGYMFWRRDNTGFWIVGFRSDNGTYANKNVLNSEQELLIGTPVTYGGSVNNTGKWSIWFNQVATNYDTLYVNRADKVLTADAFGSITTPFGTFNNVLRIHEQIEQYDSAYAYMGASLLYGLQMKHESKNRYTWWSNTVNYPVCIVHADASNNVTAVEWYQGEGFTSVQQSAQESFVNVYPNPASTKVYVKVQNESVELCKFMLYDAQGRTIIAPVTFSGETVINIEGLSAGWYFWNLVQNNTVIKGKIQITE
jgi:hypothetical protein